jgi:DNA-binding MarR family transcriptional regulator
MEPLDLNLSEACVLAFVDDNRPTNQTELASRFGMNRASAGSIVDSLSERGLVCRMPDPADRRVWLVRATPTGSKLAAEISQIDLRLRVDLRAGFSRHDRQQLAQTLVRLQENLSAVLAQD